jgi:hypothetical protein
VVRNADANRYRADVHVAVIDVPANFPFALQPQIYKAAQSPRKLKLWSR